jgi:hypothetical protein
MLDDSPGPRHAARVQSTRRTRPAARLSTGRACRRRATPPQSTTHADARPVRPRLRDPHGDSSSRRTRHQGSAGRVDTASPRSAGRSLSTPPAYSRPAAPSPVDIASPSRRRRLRPWHVDTPCSAMLPRIVSTGQDSPRLAVARRADPPPRVTSALSTWLPPCCPRAGWLTDDPGAPWLSQATSPRCTPVRADKSGPARARRHPLALLPSPIRLDSAPRHSTGVATRHSSP